MDDNQPSRFMESTPEPSNRYETDDLGKVDRVEKDGDFTKLYVQRNGGPFVIVWVPGGLQGWWTSNYRIKLSIEPVVDPIGDEMNMEAIARMAIQHGVMRLNETGNDAFEAYNVGELPEVDGSRQTALDDEARRADVFFRWVQRGARCLGFVYLKEDMTDEELLNFAYRPDQQ